MDIEKAVLSFDSFVAAAHAQARIESLVPLPSERSASAVLSVSAAIASEQASAGEGGVDCAGTLTLHLVVRAEDGLPFAFEASAGFSHRVPVEGVLPSDTALARAQLYECSCHVAEDGLLLSGVVALSVAALRPVEQSCVAALSDARGLEQQRATLCSARRAAAGSADFRLREELAVPAGQTLLSAEGQARVKSVQQERDGVLVDGTLTVNALLLDAEGNLTEKIFRVPFSEHVACEGGEGLTASVQQNDLAARLYEADDGVMELNASLHLDLWRRETQLSELLRDAYDQDNDFSCPRTETDALQYVGTRCITQDLSAPLTVPGHMPEVERVLYARALPAVTQLSTNEDGLSADGMLLVTVVYRCDKGYLHGFTADLPLSVALPEAAYSLALPSLQVRDLAVSGSGRRLQLTALLELCVEGYTAETLSYVAELAEPQSAERREGLLILFADEGDSFFSVGKRFLLSQDALRAQNPSVSEPLHAGEQLLVLPRS